MNENTIEPIEPIIKIDPAEFKILNKNDLQEMSLDNRKKYIESRDLEIYLRKMGLKSPEDKVSSRPRESYTSLSIKFGLCTTWLQYIIKKERAKYDR